LVFQEYELSVDGWISPKRKRIGAEDAAGDWLEEDAAGDWLDEDRAEDENLFLSFVGLGARGRPSDPAVMAWVHRYGLLCRGEDGRPADEDSMNVEHFRREVLCAVQMLALYRAVKDDNLGVLESVPKAGESGSWIFALSTVIDDLREHYDLRGPESSLTNASKLLREAIQIKMGDGVRPTFREPSPGDNHKFRQGWYCRDLLSAIYLLFYLFVTQGKPVRECLFCNKPIEVTRKDRYHCNANCRNNAKNKRDRERRERRTPPSL
jgi:hypothetical protein